MTHGLFASEFPAHKFIEQAVSEYKTYSSLERMPADLKIFFQQNAVTKTPGLEFENDLLVVDGEKKFELKVESVSSREIVFKLNNKKISVMESDSYQDIAHKISPVILGQSAFTQLIISDAHAISGATILVAVAAIIGIAAYMAYSTFKKNDTVELTNLTQEVCMDGAEAINRTFTETEMVLAVKRYNELSDINKKHCQMKSTKGVDPKIIQACNSLKESKKCLKDNVGVIDNSSRGSNKGKAGAVYIPSTDRFKEMTLSK